MQANLLVGQSGGCTAVINETLAGIIDASRRTKKIHRIIGMRYGIRGVLKNQFVDLGILSLSQITQLRETPASALGSCRHKIQDAEMPALFRHFQTKKIRYLLLIGGNDTAETSRRIAQYAGKKEYPLSVIAVPKTIDNDLPGMDHTPGYGSNARFIAHITQEAGKDTEAMCHVDPIKIIEVMGRNSGWLVAAAALGKKTRYDAPHLLYFPERPFSERVFLKDVQKVYERIGYCVIVMSETIRDKNGRRVGERTVGVTQDHFGHQYVNSAAAELCDLIEKKIRVRARYDKPGTIQRMSMQYRSAVDAREAYMVGKAAVRLAVQGKTNSMVTLERRSQKPYRCSTGSVSIAQVAGKEKYLPARFINKKGTFVTQAFLDYARPLVGTLPDFLRI